jgi:D-alanyl-D-alanine dipeptidase
LIDLTQPIPNRAPDWSFDKSWPISPSKTGPGEPGECVELTSFGLLGRNAYYCGADPLYPDQIPHAIPELWARRQVEEALVAADTIVRDRTGYRLYIKDAYRPVALQAHMVEIWYPDYLRTKHPDWTPEQILRETGRIWAPASSDITCPSPHLTGGAVDVFLYDPVTQVLCPMGSEFDESSLISATAYFEQASSLTPEMEQVRSNRRILYNAMTAVGFVNYPEEFWHYSLGDQEWGEATGNDALFSVMTVPA